jgi:ribosomal protein S18 acetylase RimI-like enzyme
LAVREGGRLVAGAALAVFEPPFTLFDGHAERCVLWDLRVAPHARRRGWARALLGEAINEARRQGATRLVVETQDVNVPALGLYQSAGGILRSWLPEAYETLDEVCCIFEFAW